MARTRSKSSPTKSIASLGFETKLWLTADKLRSIMDPAEYKHVVLELICLKYIAPYKGRIYDPAFPSGRMFC